ncbi:hypothetical protein B0J11DRAFT_520439 [Dendryphion nanum]|uniref:Uncharacterized protein n=1 Tax=Dendryphion nanum TaxID=256645 RepID=A0A9P9E411_9PLEO|nr:hypothetical protein B0J11DRAFT_520439 [Dendryphion nanum]
MWELGHVQIPSFDRLVVSKLAGLLLLLFLCFLLFRLGCGAGSVDLSVLDVGECSMNGLCFMGAGGETWSGWSGWSGFFVCLVLILGEMYAIVWMVES